MNEKLKKLLLEWLKNNLLGDETEEDLQLQIEQCKYSIIKDYTPDCPGWCGDILTVVFGYDTAILNFRIREDKLERINSEL